MTPTARRMSPTQAAVLLREAITRMNRRLRQTRPIGDLTVAQVSALSNLDSAGALTPRELADLERVQPPTMTKIIARLDERGLISRTPHPSDGRQAILSPSAAGRRLIGEYRRMREEWLAQRLAGLSSDDLQTLQRAAEILNRIAKD
jgi:DNA-binding MarR family transcriptional regulator